MVQDKKNWLENSLNKNITRVTVVKNSKPHTKRINCLVIFERNLMTVVKMSSKIIAHALANANCIHYVLLGRTSLNVCLTLQRLMDAIHILTTEIQLFITGG